MTDPTTWARHGLTSHQVETFQRDGVALVREVLDDAQLAALTAAVEQNIAEPSPWACEYTADRSAGRFFDDYVNWQRIGGYRDVALGSRVPHIARALMQSNSVRFFHEHVLVKEPGTATITPWHHDQPYYCVDGHQTVSLWIALDPVPAAAGVEFLAGSHRWGRQFVPRKFADCSAYSVAVPGFENVPDIEAERDEHRFVRFDVQPGDAIAFSYRTLHAAPGTAGLTAQRRRAVSMRYLGDDAVFALRPWLHSPPFDQRGLVVGGPLDDDRFPAITPGGRGSTRSSVEQADVCDVVEGTVGQVTL